MPFEIRTLRSSEIETLIEWAAAEGWNPGLCDARAFQAADPDGFIGGFVNGELVAGISAVAYGDDFGFIGLYIVRPDSRGNGYGRAVWNAGMERLQGRTIGLDGVPEQQANYRSKGFNEDYGTTRYSGRITSARGELDAGEPLTAAGIEAVADFERSYFPAARPDFLREWLTPPHRIVTRCDAAGMTGFGVARECRDGFKIGPLFACDLSIALDIVDSLGGAFPGELHIDVPDHQERFIGSLIERGLAPGFRTARMYRGAPPSIDLDGVFAVTSLELG